MLDIKFIRNNLEEIRESIKNRNLSLDIDELITLDDKQKHIKRDIEKLRAEANQTSKAMPKASANERTHLIERGTELKNLENAAKRAFVPLERSFNKLLLQVPNVMAPDTPTGSDDQENVVIRTFGQPTQFSFEPKDHLELGKSLEPV